MRAMRVSLSPLPSLVFKYACTPRQHCAVGPVTSTSSQSSRKRFFETSHACRASWKTFNDGPRHMHQNRPCPGFGRISMRFEPFVPWHWLSMERSLFPGDVSAPRRIEDKFCYLFGLFVFFKLLKGKHEKGSERCWFRGVVGRAPSAVIDASAACLLPTGSAASKKCLAGFFLNFRFAWQMKDFVCNWWCEAELRATSTKIASPFVRTDSVFPVVHLRSMGVNSATGSTGVDVNNRSKLGFWLSVFS